MAEGVCARVKSQQGLQLLVLFQPAQGGEFREAGEQLVLAQQGEQLRQRQLGVLDQPAQAQQRFGGGGDIANLVVAQLARAKMRPLAHHQAYQQCLRRLRQCAEALQEGRFLGVQQVAVAFADPGQRGAEVGEVVEAGVECDGHGS